MIKRLCTAADDVALNYYRASTYPAVFLRPRPRRLCSGAAAWQNRGTNRSRVTEDGVSQHHTLVPGESRGVTTNDPAPRVGVILAAGATCPRHLNGEDGRTSFFRWRPNDASSTALKRPGGLAERPERNQQELPEHCSRRKRAAGSKSAPRYHHPDLPMLGCGIGPRTGTSVPIATDGE